MPNATEREFAFSPTLNHRYVMEQLQPSLAYDGGGVAAWQTRFGARLRELVGVPAPNDVPLDATVLWRREHPLGSIEKIVFAAEPFCDVMAYLCLPRAVTPPYATMICLQGHTTGAHVSVSLPRDDDGTSGDDDGDRDFGLQCMERGLAALCIEQRCFGERREQHQELLFPHPCHDGAMHALMLGRTLVGERVFDVDKGLDYLASRGDIDMARVGVMGNSGGGVAAMYVAALLPRIAFAMPSCAFCTFASSFMAIVHCADNYIPGLLKYGEAADVLGLLAPKPVVAVAGRHDIEFPVAGVSQAFEALQTIYNAAGAPDGCQLVIGEGGHRFYADAAWPVLLRQLELLQTDASE